MDYVNAVFRTRTREKGGLGYGCSSLADMNAVVLYCKSEQLLMMHDSLNLFVFSHSLS